MPLDDMPDDYEVEWAGFHQKEDDDTWTAGIMYVNIKNHDDAVRVQEALVVFLQEQLDKLDQPAITTTH